MHRQGTEAGARASVGVPDHPAGEFCLEGLSAGRRMLQGFGVAA